MHVTVEKTELPEKIKAVRVGQPLELLFYHLENFSFLDLVGFSSDELLESSRLPKSEERGVLSGRLKPSPRGAPSSRGALE